MNIDPARALVDAMRDLVPDPKVPTRLATVATVAATTVTVTFDGETSASSRPYARLCGALLVGDRVVMLRVGSTWVALSSVLSAATPLVTFVPFVTAGAGAFNDLTGSTGRYRVSDRVCTFNVIVPIVNAGTASGAMNIGGMPFPSASGLVTMFTGRENQATGRMLQGILNGGSSTVVVLDYANASIIATGRTVVMSGSYPV